MKKTISLFVSAFMVGSLFIGNFVKVGATGESKVSTAEELKNAIKDSAVTTITLTADITADVTVPADKTLTLDLNGHTLTNEKDHTIKNLGYLTIVGSGTVDNVTHQKTALWNDGTAELNGGSFTRSKEAGNSSSNNGGNSYYTLLNHGDMTINAPVSVSQNGCFSSLIENGWFTKTDNKTKEPSTLTINGGTFDGGLYNLKNDDYGVLEVNGGSYQNNVNAVLLNWNKATINNGIFASTPYYVYNAWDSEDSANGEVRINGGTYTGAVENFYVGHVNSTIEITSGIFSADPTEYVMDGYKAYPVEDTFKVAPIATGIQLSDTTLTLEAGSDKTITAVVNPNETLDTVTWQSSDPKIAVVENGVVTAVAPGTATITATAGNAKAECTVSVYKVENPTPPSVDTEKPVEKPQAGLNDEKAPEILNDTLNDIISKGENSEFTDKETAEKINSAIASGETITVAPTVEEINTGNTQASEDIKAIENELKQITQENNSVTEVAMYLDLSVLVKTSTTTLGNITVLPKPVTFTVVLPNDVAENAKDKDVYVLRIHEGKVDKIKASLVDHVITFETDRFSTYAVVFEEKTVTPTPTPEETTHQVIFVDMNGAVLKVETVKDGEKATAPTAPTIEGYTFTKWDTDFSKVTKDLVVTAVYEKLPAEEIVKPDDKGENKTETEKTDNPSTGDQTNASLYSAFALLGLVSAALIVVEKKRRSLSR